MELSPVPLLDLRSVDCRLTVRVVGRFGPGVPGPHDDLEVEIAAEAGPFTFAKSDILARDELAELAACLERIAGGQPAIWRDTGRTMPIAFVPEAGGVQVTLIDETSSGARLMLPFYLEDADWISEQRQFLRQVEDQFPAESVQTSSGVWTWKTR